MNSSLRKTIAGIGAGLVASTQLLLSIPAVHGFADVPTTHWGYDYIMNGVDNSFFDGTATNFNPDRGLNRAELAKLTYKLAEMTGVIETDGNEMPSLPTGPYTTFTDVKTTDWFAAYVYQLTSQGILSGYKNADGTATGMFGPGDTVTRAQAVKAFVMAGGFEVPSTVSSAPFPDVPATHWAAGAVEVAKEECIIAGYANGNFGPNDPVTRAQAAKVLDRSLNPTCDDVVTNGNTNGGTNGNMNGVISGGSISISVASTNPASSSIIAGQTLADLAHFTFSGKGTLTNLKLKRLGASSDSTINNVYLYDGANRLTDNASVNTSGIISFNNSGGLFTVDGTKTLSVKADIATNSTSNPLGGQTIGVMADSYMLYGSTDAMTVSNVSGNLHTISVVQNLSAINLGNNTAPTATVNAGTIGYNAWTSPVTVSGRSAMLKNATFKYIGSAPYDALQNITLFVDGTKVKDGATINPMGFIVFDLSAAPYTLTTGSHTVDVRVDIIKGSSRNFTLQVQNSGDFYATDSQLGVGSPVTSPTSATTFSSNSGGTVTINSGTVTTTIDPTFTTFTTVTGGATNAVIGRFKMKAYGEDVKVQSLTVLPALSGTTPPAAGLNNVQLYWNGGQVGSSQNWTSGNLSYNLGSSLIAMAGTEGILEVRADIQTNGFVSYTAGTVTASLISATTNGQGQTSFNTTGVPSATIATSGLTIGTGVLGIAKNPGYTNQSIGPNTPNAKVGSFVLQNTSSSESVRVTNLAASLAFTGSQAYTNYSNLKTSETSGSGGTPIAPAAGSPSVNNFSVNFILAPGETKVIDVMADISSISTGTLIVTLTPTAIGQSSNVNVSPSGVAGQTITVATGTVATPTLLTSSSTVAQYIAAGGAPATDATTAVFNVVSTSASSTISELKFNVTASAGTPVSSVKVGSISAPVVAGVAYLTGLNIAVPNGGSGTNIEAKVTYGPVGTTGEIPGTTTNIALSYIKYTSGGTTTTITPSVAAPSMTMVGSRPTPTVNTAQASGLILGAENKIGEVTIAADAKGNIKLNDIRFNVGSSNISTFAITSPRIADGTTTITGSSCGANATVVFCEFGTTGNTFATSTTVTNTEVNTDFDGFTIPAGTSKTFTLYGVVGGTVTTAGGTTTVSTSLDSTGFNWDDASYASFVADGTAASPANGTNLTGSLIYNFPTGSYSIKQ